MGLGYLYLMGDKRCFDNLNYLTEQAESRELFQMIML